MGNILTKAPNIAEFLLNFFYLHIFTEIFSIIHKIMTRLSLLTNSYLLAIFTFACQLFAAPAQASDLPHLDEDGGDDDVTPKLASSLVAEGSAPQVVDWRSRLRRNSWEKLQQQEKLSDSDGVELDLYSQNSNSQNPSSHEKSDRCDSAPKQESLEKDEWLDKTSAAGRYKIPKPVKNKSFPGHCYLYPVPYSLASVNTAFDPGKEQEGDEKEFNQVIEISNREIVNQEIQNQEIQNQEIQNQETDWKSDWNNGIIDNQNNENNDGEQIKQNYKSNLIEKLKQNRNPINQNPPTTKQNQEKPNSEQPVVTSSSDTTATADTKDFSVFPVGINIGRRNVLRSTLIRGREDGEKPVNFDAWSVPFDAVVDALRLTVKTLDDGQLEIRSPGVVTRVNPQELKTDPELGLVFSVAEIRRLFGVGIEFDMNEYAIAFDLPWLGKGSGQFAQEDLPVVFDGLTQFQPGGINLTAVEQRLNAAGGSISNTNYRGDFQAVGSSGGGSWFIRTDQPNFNDRNTWRIAEAQFLRQTNQADYFIGSHPTFWQRQNNAGFFGFTLINRQGFRPPQRLTNGFSDPRQRLQAAQVGRTITGQAEPGSLVRLVEGFGEVAIAEVFVDSSGTYRFENITTKNDAFETNYRVFIYPEGRLTATPEIRSAEVSTVPGQIPVGASAWVASGGYRRRLDRDGGLFGNFTEFSGGVAGRWGVSEALTLGLGSVYDEGVRGLAEMFYRPRNFPLEMAVSAVSGDEWDIISNIRFEPSRRFSVNFNSDRLSQRLNVNWNLFRGLSVFANTDSRNPTSAGMQFNFSGRGYSTFGRVSLNADNQLRWNWLQRLGRAELRQNGNEIGSLSEFTYNFSRSNSRGHALLLNYETRSQNQNNNQNNLLTLGWRYRSPARTNDGYYRWEGQIGYAMGSRGNGVTASLGTTIIPGILLRARYQGVSLTSDESSFSVDLVSSLNTQAGFSAGDRRAEYLRTQGGLMLRPFYDKNANGKRDGGEEFYTENSESLVIVNNKPIKRFQSEIQRDRINIRLFPGTYRVDLDPAGYPVDWQTNEDAIAVQVIAGSYTPVMIPLVRAYSRSGVITDTQGQPIAGARVEAISSNGKRRFSVTNSAGVYYLERLQEGEYQLVVNGKSASNLKLESASEPFQELNFQVSGNMTDKKPEIAPANPLINTIRENQENNEYEERLNQLLKRLTKNISPGSI